MTLHNIQKQAQNLGICIKKFGKRKSIGNKVTITTKTQYELIKEISKVLKNRKLNTIQEEKFENYLQHKNNVSIYNNITNRNIVWIKYTNKTTGKELYKSFKKHNGLFVKFNNSGELYINI